MKKFLTVAIILLMLSAQVEAVPFTRTQFDKIFQDAEQVQAESSLNLNAADFKEKFNGLIKSIIAESMNPADASAMEHLFRIENYKVIGKTLSTMFGDYRALIVGLNAEDGNFKVLSLCYTTPEDPAESLFTIWLLTAFVKSISPETDFKTLMNDLTAENSSGSVVTGDVKFSVKTEGNLNTLTAIATK